MCRVFREVEKIIALDHHRYEMLMPIPTYTWFPHRNYSTLKELMDKLNEEYAALSDLIVWEVCAAPETLSVGMKCQATFVNEYDSDSDDDDGTFKDATIEKVNGWWYTKERGRRLRKSSTFDVVFDDEVFETRKNVPLNEIQIQNVSANDLLWVSFSIFYMVSCSHSSSSVFSLSIL
jgi:hypothetical protein